MQAKQQHAVACRLIPVDTTFVVESWSPSSPPLKKMATATCRGFDGFDFHALSPSSVHPPVFFQQQRTGTPPPIPPKSVRFRTTAAAELRYGATSGSRKRKLDGTKISPVKKTILCKVSHYTSEEGENFTPNAPNQLPVLTRRTTFFRFPRL